MNIKVKSFDINAAKKELKNCPFIVKQYVNLLNDAAIRQQNIINKQYKKLKILTDKKFLVSKFMED